MKLLHLLWLKWTLRCMRSRHVELYARGMEHQACECFLSAKEHFHRAYLLSSEICRLRQLIRRVERQEC